MENHLRERVSRHQRQSKQMANVSGQLPKAWCGRPAERKKASLGAIETDEGRQSRRPKQEETFQAAGKDGVGTTLVGAHQRGGGDGISTPKGKERVKGARGKCHTGEKGEGVRRVRWE